jgi:hypothetical protein
MFRTHKHKRHWVPLDDRLQHQVVLSVDYDELARDYAKTVATLTKIRDWLERLANTADETAKDTRFISLSEASKADAKNFRAIIKDIDAAIN